MNERRCCIAAIAFACFVAAATGHVASEHMMLEGATESQMMFYQSLSRDEPDEQLTSMRDAPVQTLLTATLRVVNQNQCSGSYVYCTASCAQGKLVMKSTGCCLCTCGVGFALASDNQNCNTASWGSWSSWSTCITSAWGGLQTRERICQSGGQTALSRCVGGGSEERTCSAVTKPFRIRKNVRSLTDEEVHDLIQAYSKFKNEDSSDGFMYIVKWHGWPFECPWYKTIEGHQNGHCSWHAHPMFLAWHRLIIVQLEMGFNKYLKDKSLGMPYWDWTEPGWDHLPNLVRDPDIFDPVEAKWVKNPFYATQMPLHPKVFNETCKTWRYPDFRGLSWQNILLRSVIRAVTMPDYAKYDAMLEEPHNQVHNCICDGKTPFQDTICLYSMLSITYSAFDPVFGLHHSQIDRLYCLFKEIRDVVGNQDWTKSSFIGSYIKYGEVMTVDKTGSYDWPMSPFCNKSMNLNQVTLNENVWTVRYSYYYQQLFGYKYDSLNLNGLSWKKLVLDVQEKQSSLYYGLVLPFRSHMAPYLGTISSQNTKFKSGCSLPPVKCTSNQ